MSDSPIQSEPADAPAPKRRWLSVLSYLFALGLLGTCIWLAVGQSEGEGGWENLRNADPIDALLMMLMLVASIGLNGWVFELVLRPFTPTRPVGVMRMSGLIAASSLLNYLPMRAGMIGRVAYLKKRHGIGYKASVVQLLFVAGATVLVYGLLAAMTLWTDALGIAWWGGLAGGAIVISGCLWAGLLVGEKWAPAFARRWFEDGHEALKWCRNHPSSALLGVSLIVVLRLVDVATVGTRLYLAARILGMENLPADQIILMATGGMFIRIATPLPNGLGLQEWIYGLLHETHQQGLRLGLVDRCVEAVAIIACGLVAIGWMHKEKGGAEEEATSAPTREGA
jgi:uncharacterized membrane protein YbhN (UPF0104 family)